MKVIFPDGIIKNVSDGYARNFLLPRGLAKPATDDAVKQSEVLAKKREAQAVNDKQRAEEWAKKLESAVVEIHEGANAEGHLYGSVDAKKIATAIEKTYHVKLSEDQIDLPQHLKTVGEHAVKLKLYQTIETTLIVRVLPS